MRKLLVKIIHRFNRNFFAPKSYRELGLWGIEDIINGKIYFEDGTTYGGGEQ
jgi:hypothetical protein